MADRALQAAIYASLQSAAACASRGGGGGGDRLMPSAGRGPVGQQHMQRLHERERLTPAASSRTSAQPLRTLKSTTAGTLAREGIMASNTPHLGGNTDRRMMENRERSASPRERARRHQCGGDAATPMGMPSNLPHDAERTLSKRLAKHGVKELAVPLGDGWMQRAGRGSFAVVEETGTRSGPVMQVDSIEPNYYLLTYDQTPDAHIVKTGQYRLEASVRCMPGHTVKEHPYCALVINWQRGRSTITAPCCTALVLAQGCWRLEQYADGQQTILCEVRDSSLKAGGAFQRVEIEVRGGKIAVSANKRVIIGSFAIPPQTDGSLAAGGRSARAAALTGPCGVAVYRSRAQLRYF